jgi:hypothetical protein
MSRRHRLRRAYAAPLLAWLVAMTCIGTLSWRRAVDTTTLPWLERVLVGRAFVHTRFAYDSDAIAVLAAVPYLAHFVLPFVAGAYIGAVYVWSFGVMNCAALCVQLALPTAPPWWYAAAGRNLTRGGDAGDAGDVLRRVDALVGVPLFDAIYRSAPVVYGAFPSLHAAWPLHAALMARTRHPAAYAYVAWVWWAAVYLKHHFVVDIIGAVVLAVCVVGGTRAFFGSRAPQCGAPSSSAVPPSEVPCS